MAKLAGLGAQPQRPLWASTGVKNPAYPDTMYVTELVAADTVNTMPGTTLAAFADHGEVTGNTIRGRYHDARRVLDQLATIGVDFEDVTGQLEREGLAKFEKSWNQLSHTIAAELHRSHPARQSRPRRGSGPHPLAIACTCTTALDLIRLLSTVNKAIRPCQSGRFHYLDIISCQPALLQLCHGRAMQHPARLGRVDEHDGVAAIKPGTPQNYGRISWI